MSDEATFVALVHAHITKNADYESWVKPYLVKRKAGKSSVNHTLYRDPDNLTAPPRRLLPGQTWHVVVGGHYRRKALYGTLNRALACTCKFERIC